MKPLIFIFPGQASQYVGMGRDLYENSPSARGLMDRATKMEGLQNLRTVTFDGPEELLTRTDNVQPALTVVSLMALAALYEKTAAAGIMVAPLACAGHSLGEYAAHAAARNLDFEQAVLMTRKRGFWMNEASQPPHANGGMIAIMGLALESVKEIVLQVGADRISLANVNSPGQFILSGGVEAIAEATTAVQAAGAKRVIPLNVSGAWHSPLMKPAQKKMVEFLTGAITPRTVRFNAQIKVIANASSEVVTGVDDLRETLGQQITSPVIWTECVRRLVTSCGYPGLPGELTPEQIEQYSPWPLFVEIGPGKVLRGLIRNIDKGLETAGVEDSATINTFLQQIAG